jgi:hypothetical protein
MGEASRSFRDGGEERPPFLFVARSMELVCSPALALTKTDMLTTADRIA